MIYVHIHGHEWRATSATVHDHRVYRCRVCGDQAYCLDPSEVARTVRNICEKRTDFPLAG